MRLQNFSKLQAHYTMGLQKDGKECVVIVAKGSWSIPFDEEKPKLIFDNPLPMIEADEFLGEPGFSPLKYDNDFVRFKPYCDVIMHASAYADVGYRAKYVDVNLRVDDKIDKSIRVHGPRVWRSDLGLVSISESEYFERQAIHYGIAYGGMDRTWEDEGQTATYLANPVGIGYLPNAPRKVIVGQPAPQLESLKHRISGVNDYSPAMSFGPISKNYSERLQYAGTYDDYWNENIRPLLPDDFDERFYQCAPCDQQMPYIKGGERVTLSNLCEGRKEITFTLPDSDIYMAVQRKGGDEEILDVCADTLIIEPEEKRFSIVYRAHTAIQYYSSELETLIVGKPTKAWRRAKMLGKTYKRNIGDKAW